MKHLAQHRSYVFPGGGVSSTHAELVASVLPRVDRFPVTLKLIADNAQLGDLQSTYLRPLWRMHRAVSAACATHDTRERRRLSGAKTLRGNLGIDRRELDAGKLPDRSGKMAKSHRLIMLSPLVVALTSLQESPAAVDKTGSAVSGRKTVWPVLSAPFQAPVQRVVRLGQSEIEHTLAEYWQAALRPGRHARQVFRSIAARKEP